MHKYVPLSDGTVWKAAPQLEHNLTWPDAPCHLTALSGATAATPVAAQPLDRSPTKAQARRDTLARASGTPLSTAVPRFLVRVGATDKARPGSPPMHHGIAARICIPRYARARPHDAPRASHASVPRTKRVCARAHAEGRGGTKGHDDPGVLCSPGAQRRDSRSWHVRWCRRPRTSSEGRAAEQQRCEFDAHRASCRLHFTSLRTRPWAVAC